MCGIKQLPPTWHCRLNDSDQLALGCGKICLEVSRGSSHKQPPFFSLCLTSSCIFKWTQYPSFQPWLIKSLCIKTYAKHFFMFCACSRLFVKVCWPLLHPNFWFFVEEMTATRRPELGNTDEREPRGDHHCHSGGKAGRPANCSSPEIAFVASKQLYYWVHKSLFWNWKSNSRCPHFLYTTVIL